MYFLRNQEELPMIRIIRLILLTGLISIVPIATSAQIIPDRSLGREASIVTPNQQIRGVESNLITGGAIRGSNLFQSFGEFNVGEGKGVYFFNPGGVVNIITRVTGGKSSSIFGQLGVLGDANLFLINPSGIIFGANAKLDLSGSFLATTASGLMFDNGYIYDARNPNSVPLLTINIPIGLNFKENPGSIQVIGQGHNYIRKPIANVPNIPLNNQISFGLAVPDGKTISFIGGDINFSGGVATALSGKILIGSINSGFLGLSQDASGNLTFDYSGVYSYKNILFSKLAFLNASSLPGSDKPGGVIELQGQNIDLTDSSLVLVENLSDQKSGSITVTALDTVRISSIGLSTPIYPNFVRPSSGLITQAEEGTAGDISVYSKHLQIQNNGFILSFASGSASTGNVNINSSELVTLTGNSLLDPLYPASSVIGTIVTGNGIGGTISLDTNQLIVSDGSFISTTTYGLGKGGNIRINAKSSTTIDGYNVVSFLPSEITGATVIAGQGGDVVLNTKELNITNGAVLVTTTFGAGNAGILSVAADTIRLSGFIPQTSLVSTIAAFASKSFPSLISLFGIPSSLSGDSGNLIINSRNIYIDNFANISVGNEGLGKAGNLFINSSSIQLTNRGAITASTARGDGGDISIFAKILRADKGSTISSSARGPGDGGNVAINAGAVVLSRGSSITADAFLGRGGKISIFTRGLFKSADSFITATSEAGENLNGVVEINTLGQELTQTTLPPVEKPKPDTKPACGDEANTSSLTIPGSGGVTPRPDDIQDTRTTWQDNLEDSSNPSIPKNQEPLPSKNYQLTTVTYPVIPSKRAKAKSENENQIVFPFVEAQGFAKKPDGSISLVVQTDKVVPSGSLTSPSCNPLADNDPKVK
jgi:filamentous hemagglutinin family protein